MSAPLPHLYEVSVAGPAGPRGTASAGPRPPLEGGPPPEFGGDDSRWSPEHLLLSSASLCLMATFAAVAAKSRFEYAGYECRAKGTLDKTPEGIRFTKIVFEVLLRAGPAEAERALKLLETAKKHCLISNSLRAESVLEARVEPA